MKNKIIIVSLFLASVSSVAMAQNEIQRENTKTTVSSMNKEVVVKGIVFDGRKQPLSDAVISYGGKDIRTDENGRFQLETVSPNASLRVWCEGYYQQNVVVNGRSELNVYLIAEDSYKYNNSALKPFENIEDATHEVSLYNVNKKNFALGAMSVERALQGEVPGLQVIHKGGMTGEGAYFNLGGVRSLLAENAPLIVINGVPYMANKNTSYMIDGYSRSVFQALNAQDIQNITVLTGADAAMYGSMGSNGVILIETDGASSDDMETKISYSAMFGMNYNNKRLPMMNAAQYKSYLSDVGMTYYNNMEEFFSEFSFLQNPNAAYHYLYNKDTDWQDEIYENSFTHDHLFRVEGGDAIAKYDISFGYSREEGTLKGTNTDRYSAQINTNVLASKQFQINAIIGLSYLSGKYQNQGLTLETTPLMAAYRRSPLLSPYKSDMYGNLLDTYSSYYYGVIQNTDFIVSNPVSLVNNMNAINHQFDVNSKVQLVYKPNAYFTADAVVGLYYNYNKEETFIPGIDNMDIVPTYDQYGEAENKVLAGFSEDYNFFLNVNAAYKRTFGVHGLNAKAGWQMISTESEYDAGSGRNTASDFYQTLESIDGIGKYILGYNNKWNWMSGYAHVDYTYNNMARIGANLSLDAASSTGVDATRLGIFPSADATLMLKNFSFMKDVDFINNLDLYASYSLTGNSQFSSKLGRYYYVTSPFAMVAGVVRANVPNTKLTWEKNNQFNVGLKTSLLRNRLGLSFRYFNNKATDVLMISPNSSAFGTGNYYCNDGEIDNQGLEASLNVTPVLTRSFSWTLGGNIAHSTSEITALGRVNQVVNTLTDGAELLNRVGETPNSFYGYKALGIFSTTKEAQEAALVNKNGIPYEAGDVHYEDVNKDGYINDKDKQVIGSATPDFYGSFFNRLEYKGFALDLTFVYSVGNDAYNAVRRITESSNDFSNQSKAVNRRWSMEGQQTDMPRVQYGDKVGNNNFSSRWIEDASYLKLRDITFSYTFNKPVWNFFRGGTLYVTGQNLICFTKYLGMDPEYAYSYSEGMRGVDYGKVAMPKSVKVGVNLKF